MAISTYAELQTAIADWLNRADLVERIPDFIRLAEGTLNRVLRDGDMAATSSITVATTGIGTLPSNVLETIYAQVTGDATAPLEQVTASQLLMLRRNRMKTAGTPRFYAIIGREIHVAPVPASETAVDVTYHGSLPPLSSNSTNWLLTKAPQLYLYTSLLHAAPFLKDNERTMLFQQMVSAQIVDAVRADRALSFEDLKVPGFSLSAVADTGSAAPQAAPTVGDAG